MTIRAAWFAAAPLGLLVTLSGSARAGDPPPPQEPMSAAQERKIVEGHLGEIKACMKKAGGDGPEGKLAIKYIILPSGKTEKAHPIDSTTGSAAMDDCFAEVFRKMTFPSGFPPQERRYPFAFAPRKADLTDQQIVDTVKAHIGDVKACYEDALKEDHELKGKLVIEFTVAQDGKVAATRKVEGTVQNQKVVACILDKAKTWPFPKPKGVGNVVFPYPFDLNPVAAPKKEEE
jgi:hypothetical protein